MCGLLPSLPSLQNVVSQKTLLRMQYHAMRTKCWTTFAGISDKLIGCCKEELTTDGVVVALSFCLSVCLSARPTQAPPYLTPLCVLHMNALSFVCGHDVILEGGLKSSRPNNEKTNV